MYNSTKQ